jgi:AraC-like DNA-binding protein
LARSILIELETPSHGMKERPRGRPAAVLVAVEPPPASADLREVDTSGAPWRPRPVDRAIKIMEAAPDAAMSVTDLARETDVSVRTLQAAFRRHTGTSPMGYLRQLRLTLAHEDLLAADPRRQTVAGIAHRHGFLHLGRFAATYRARYGCNPSTTLQLDPITAESASSHYSGSDRGAVAVDRVDSAAGRWGTS